MITHLKLFKQGQSHLIEIIAKRMIIKLKLLIPVLVVSFLFLQDKKYKQSYHPQVQLKRIDQN